MAQDPKHRSRQSNNRILFNGIGCLWWIIGIPALMWWLKGQRWGIIALIIMVILSFLFWVFNLIDKKIVNKAEKSRKSIHGKITCHQCHGSGWVKEDMYSLITCPLCNGSGWEDVPAEGPPLMREDQGF